ncbi:MAG: T9SS type A sorting domain-containing protein, partial [Candidatus Eisenbacteria bacterium]|nr:T9SS type A sorting domain-containing protein [Candidatus Eisenbacteria bacterium]
AGENEVVVSLDGRTVFDLEVVDVAGRHVRNLAQGDRPAGSYSFSWNGEDQLGQRVPNGVYFVRLRTPGTQQVRKTILVE